MPNRQTDKSKINYNLLIHCRCDKDFMTNNLERKTVSERERERDGAWKKDHGYFNDNVPFAKIKSNYKHFPCAPFFFI